MYINRPDPISFLPAAVDTTGRLYDDFSRLLFLHVNREASALSNEIPEESDQFRFLRAASYANSKGSVGLILAKTWTMRISIPLTVSARAHFNESDSLAGFGCESFEVALSTGFMDGDYPGNLSLGQQTGDGKFDGETFLGRTWMFFPWGFGGGEEEASGQVLLSLFRRTTR